MAIYSPSAALAKYTKKKETTTPTTTTKQTTTTTTTEPKTTTTNSSYSANSNWDNEKAYLTNLAQNGTDGEKIWANNQLGVLEKEQAQYSPTASSSYSANTNWDNERNYLLNLAQNGTDGEKAWANNQLGVLANAQSQYISMEAPNNQYDANIIYIPTYDYSVQKPTYENQYDATINEALNKILNRDAFSYNVEEDPLFQQYKQMYMREGDRAMRDTMAEAAAGAGGMNTYAMTAASQANNYYNSMLNDKIPELYQAAYDKYLKDIDMKINDLGLLQKMDETQYNRYRDTMDNWYKDRNFAYGMYRDDVGDSQWNKTFDYNVGRDAVADSQWEKTFDYNVGRDNVLDSQWQQQFDYNAGRDDVSDSQWQQEWSYKERETAKEELWKLLDLGVDATAIPAELIQKAGMDEATIKLIAEEMKPLYEQVWEGRYNYNLNNDPWQTYKQQQQQQHQQTPDPETDPKTDPTTTTQPETKQPTTSPSTTTQPETKQPETEDKYTASLWANGSPISQEKITDLVLAGAVIVNEEGKYKWADGYGPEDMDDILVTVNPLLR